MSCLYCIRNSSADVLTFDDLVVREVEVEEKEEMSRGHDATYDESLGATAGP